MILVAALVAMPLIALISRRLRLRYTVAMVLVGLDVSALPGRYDLGVSSGVAVTVQLPGLVHVIVQGTTAERVLRWARPTPDASRREALERAPRSP